MRGRIGDSEATARPLRARRASFLGYGLFTGTLVAERLKAAGHPFAIGRGLEHNPGTGPGSEHGAEALAFDGPCVADYAGRMLRALALAVVVASAAGCDGALLRTLSEDQAGQLCVQKGGWWRADGERGGYCERQSAN
jgi:hypothetical protein